MQWVVTTGRTVEEARAVAQVPWGPILMVTGVSLLVGVLEATGGLDLFTTLLSRLATPLTVNGGIAFVTGAISIFSSTSGVVLPAFLPTSPGIVEQLGGSIIFEPTLPKGATFHVDFPLAAEDRD